MDNPHGAALDYHGILSPGKRTVAAAERLPNESDLGLAYAPTRAIGKIKALLVKRIV